MPNIIILVIRFPCSHEFWTVICIVIISSIEQHYLGPSNILQTELFHRVIHALCQVPCDHLCLHQLDLTFQRHSKNECCCDVIGGNIFVRMCKIFVEREGRIGQFWNYKFAGLEESQATFVYMLRIVRKSTSWRKLSMLKHGISICVSRRKTERLSDSCRPSFASHLLPW